MTDPFPLLSWLPWDQQWLSGRKASCGLLSIELSPLWAMGFGARIQVYRPCPQCPTSPRDSWEEKCYSWGQAGSHSHSSRPENPFPPLPRFV